MNVIVDAGPAVHQSAGLSRYAERLIYHLALREELNLTLFYNSHSAHRLPQSLAGLRCQTVPLGQLSWRLRVLLSQLLHQTFFHGVPHALPDLPSSTHLFHATEHLLPYLRMPTVMTVHDLIFEKCPEHHTLRNRLYLRLAMPLYVKRATQIVAVSKQTKRDLEGIYGVDGNKIEVIHEGVDERFVPASSSRVTAVKQKYGLVHPYLLMVGTLEPRKNHLTAMRALLRLRQEGFAHQLLIAGGKGWLFEPIQTAVKQLGLQENVIFAGYVPEEDLPCLYSGADCVLVPSLYEGFGFSVVEAMACKTPVVCSQGGSLGEIAGDAALLLADPLDDEELAHQIQQVLTQPDLAGKLVEAGLRRAAAFRWSTAADATADLYRSVVRDGC